MKLHLVVFFALVGPLLFGCGDAGKTRRRDR